MMKQFVVVCALLSSITACKKHDDKSPQAGSAAAPAPATAPAAAPAATPPAAPAPATAGGTCPADMWKPADFPVCIKLPAGCKQSADDKNVASCEDGGLSVELQAQSYEDCLKSADGGSHGKFDDIDKKSFLASGDFLDGKGKWFTYKREHMIGLFSCIQAPGDKVLSIDTSTDAGDQAQLDAIEHATWAK